MQKRKAKSQSAVPDVTPTLDCQGVQIKGNLHKPAAMGRPQRGNRLRLVFQRERKRVLFGDLICEVGNSLAVGQGDIRRIPVDR